MKKLLTLFLFIFIFSGLNSAQAADKNCTQLMNDFDNFGGTIPADMRDNLQVCQIYCSKIGNYQQARDSCGVEECKTQAATTGKPSTWCCSTALYWQNKLGVKSNPLAPLIDICAEKKLNKPDFIQCAERMRGGNPPLDECCSVYREVKKFDAIMGFSLNNHCQKKNIPTN